jgi:2-polyprenyl-3-methyl-5-hydroxy-6-metoxy-1,4-benzoquinol methylase
LPPPPPVVCKTDAYSNATAEICKSQLREFSSTYDLPIATSAGYWMDEGFDYTSKLEAKRVMLMRDLVAPKSMARILDLGCGRGRLARWLHSLGQREYFYYQGIDVNSDDINSCMVYESQSWSFSHFDMENSMYNIKNTYFENDHNQNPVFPCLDSTFDIIYSWSVFSHLEPNDIEYYLKLFHSLLSDRGIVFVTFHENEKCNENPTYNPGWWTFEGGGEIQKGANKLLVVAYHPDWIRNILHRYGFSVLFKHYPIVASNRQVGYYLIKM